MTTLAPPPPSPPPSPDVAPDEPVADASPVAAQPAQRELAVGSPGPGRLVAVTSRRLAGIALTWVVVTVLGVICVIYGLGPMLEQRDQRNLLADYRDEIARKSVEAEGLEGIEEVTEAPAAGDPVAIVEINDVETRQVVVEGVGPSQTRRGPGHVPGTAGPGQPGNSVVVGRQTSFGGPFAQLDELRRGDEIAVVTTQGESLYVVDEVRSASLPREAEDIYGPSRGNQLTLVTSDSGWPWSKGRATVVVAKIRGLPFEPTPQGGRLHGQDGRDGDASALAPVLLGLIGYASAAAAAVLLYRRTRPRSAYLMSAPLLVVAVVLVAEASARLLPAWF